MKATLITLFFLGGAALAADYSGDIAWSADSQPTFTFDAGDLTVPLELTLSTESSYRNTDYLTGAFTPDVNVGNGGSWTLSFSLRNTGSQELSLTGIDIDIFSFTSGGGTQHYGTNRSVKLTLSGGVSGTVDSYTILGSMDGSLATTALTMEKSVSIAAGETLSFDLKVERAEGETNGTFVGLQGVTFVVESVPEPATATLGLLALAGVVARRRRR